MVGKVSIHPSHALVRMFDYVLRIQFVCCHVLMDTTPAMIRNESRKLTKIYLNHHKKNLYKFLGDNTFMWTLCWSSVNLVNILFPIGESYRGTDDNETNFVN